MDEVRRPGEEKAQLEVALGNGGKQHQLHHGQYYRVHSPMGKLNQRGLWAQKTMLHRTGSRHATTRMECENQSGWSGMQRFCGFFHHQAAKKDLGIHGQALQQIIGSVSEAAERSSQWIRIKQKDPCWARSDPLTNCPPPLTWEPRSEPSKRRVNKVCGQL